MRKKGFTLVELLAVIVILAIILAIAVPGISGIIKSSTMSSMESDAKLVLKSIDLKKLGTDSFNPLTLDHTNINDELGISNDKYQSLNISIIDGTTYITIVGQGKWAGFSACGSYKDMRVREGACELDFVAPVIALTGGDTTLVSLGEIYTEPGVTANDAVDGDLTTSISITGTVDANTVGTYTITYIVSDSMGNTATETRTVLVMKSDFTIGGSLVDFASDIIKTSDGGYAIGGYTQSSDGDITDGNNGGHDVLLAKLSSSLELEWSKTYGGSGSDTMQSLIQTSDGGYVLVGQSNSIDGDITDGNNGSYDALIIKVSSTGTIEWNRTIGGSGGNELFYSVVETDDGGYVAVGKSDSNDGDITDGNNGSHDVLLVKVSSTGTLSWDKTYGGSGDDVGNKIVNSNDGNYFVVGNTASSDFDITDGNNGGSEALIMKITPLGEKTWDKTYGSSGSESFEAIFPTDDGGCIAAGFSSATGGEITDGNSGGFDALVIKLASNGGKEWDRTIGGSLVDIGYSVVETSDGGYVIVGRSQSTNGDITDGNNGEYDILMFKLTSAGSLSWNRTYGGTYADYGNKVLTMGDNYVVAGYTKSSDGDVTDVLKGEGDGFIFVTLSDGSKL